MSKLYDVAIVGSGPYGLSLAAHLEKSSVSYCIFGKAMGSWRANMPQGMCLKSEGFASNLYHPERLFTLEEFCRDNSLPYAHIGEPVRLSTFTSYGVAFQKRFVPNLNEMLVVNVQRQEGLYCLTLEDGSSVMARRVVVAAGITHFKTLPAVLQELPAEVMSHSSEHHSLRAFKGKEVAVIGAGSSAIDVAAGVHDAGGKAILVTRRVQIPFHGKAPLKRTLAARVRNPWSGLGPSWRSRLACDLPDLFHVMPYKFRLKVVRKHLGPVAGWFTRDKIQQNVPMQTNVSLAKAELVDGRVSLTLKSPGQEAYQLVVDHVIAGTGYHVDVRRLSFLEQSLSSLVTTEEDSPVLSHNFESSVPGLYFVGTVAALSFGPLLRFAFGAGFASRRMTSHLARVSRADQRKAESRATSSSRTSVAKAGYLENLQDPSK